jgi:hypothetical protein
MRLFHQVEKDLFWVELQGSDLDVGPTHILAPVLRTGDPRVDRTDLRVPINHSKTGEAVVVVDLMRPIKRGGVQYAGDLSDLESEAIRDVMRLIFDL